MNRFLIVVTGPTASGKTQASIELARHFHSHIISADARQFYLEMNIGTAKPSLDQLAAAPHHFINHLSIGDSYSAGQFEQEAISFIDDDLKNHSVITLVGGSGLFIRAVLEGFDSFPPEDPEVKEKLQDLFKAEGLVALQQLLRSYDPVYYDKVDLNNPQRLIRAMSVCLTSGKPFSSFHKQQRKQRNFTPVKIGMKVEKEELHRRIDERVEQMMLAGLPDEAAKLFPLRRFNALQTVGYTELFEFLEQKITMDEAVAKIKRNTRQYARRQMTWFKKEKDIAWFAPDEAEKIAEYIEGKMMSGE